MKKGKATLIEAVLAIRQSNFEKAFDLADSQARNYKEDFWAWYIAAVSLGFLKKKDTFEHYVSRAVSLNPESPFVLYLQAYLSLQKKDIETALIIWTRLIDHEEGWLARELIEKARKSNSLINKAENCDISYFIVIPDFPDDRKAEEDYTPKATFQKKIESGYQKNKNTKSFLAGFSRNAIIITIAALLVFAFYQIFSWYLSGKNNEKPEMWKNLRIEEWAALVNTQTSDKEKFEYKNKDDLIEDFELAKKKLSEKKINQSRYLLQKILNSNADFKSKEKSKIFLSFIPEPDYQEFSDPVMPDKLVKSQAFYFDSIVLWQGTVLNIKDVDNGKEIRLLIKSDSEDYIVEAFLPGIEKKSNWMPFGEYQKGKDMKEKKTQAIVYGKFKGLIGKQKNIYLELIKLWM